jgi:hypothetical protein
LSNDNFSLGEYLSQAQRSMGGGYFGRTSGPLSGYLFGPDFFRKQTYLQISDTFTATYGKKVWDALNNKTVTFNALKKVDWGPTVGWRLRTDRGSGRSRPVTETGALPTIDVSNYAGVYSYPRNIVSTFGVSLKGQAVSALEGGIGNQFAVEQEAASRDHVKEINYELMSGGGVILYGAGSSGSPTTYYGVVGNTAADYLQAGIFHIGDTVASSNSDSATATVTAVDTTNGRVTIGTTNLSLAQGQSLYIKARAGLTSLDDIVTTDSAKFGNVTTPIDVYNLQSDNASTSTRTAGGPFAAAYCSDNAGVGRNLTLSLMDYNFQYIRQNGGEPKLIITGLDQYDRLNQLLQAQQRFVDVTDYIVGAGDERTYPGTRAGFQLATYRGIPILPDPDTAKSMNSSYVTLGSNVYVLDTDYLEIAVMYPTQYVENRDYFAMKQSGEEKSYYMLENPVHPLVPEWVIIYEVGTISREDCNN